MTATNMFQAKYQPKASETPRGDGLGASPSAFSDGEGPECPFCGRMTTADEPEDMDETPHEVECGGCGKTFLSECQISIAWRTYSLPNAERSDRHGQ